MSNKRPIDLPINSKKSSKKIPPPPLCLPESNSNIVEENISHSNMQTSSSIATTHCCSSTTQCSHQSISYTLPVCQRSKILDTLVDSSSRLLVSSSTAAETRHKKSNFTLNSHQINFLKQLQATRQNAIQESEWLDFLRLVLQKSFEDELILLLDKYKKTYFDRINSPNTTDKTIRDTLCEMVSQTLVTYSYDSTTLANEQTSSTTNSSSSSSNKIFKRKRDNSNRISCEQSIINLTNQTKFVISYIIPDENSNQKTNNQQQFQKKFSHLFKYIPTIDEQLILIQQRHLKSSNDNQICLMLYDEIILYMDESDLEISGISIDDSFTLNQSFLENIKFNFS